MEFLVLAISTSRCNKNYRFSSSYWITIFFYYSNCKWFLEKFLQTCNDLFTCTDVCIVFILISIFIYSFSFVFIFTTPFIISAYFFSMLSKSLYSTFYAQRLQKRAYICSHKEVRFFVFGVMIFGLF